MAPAAGLIDLGVVLGLGFMIALLWVYRYTFGALIVGLAQLIGSIRLPGFIGGARVLGFAADALTGLDNAIRHSLGVGIAAMQATWNECISYTAYAIRWWGKELASLSHDTAQAVEGLTVKQVTNVYRKVNPGLAAKVGALAATVAALTARLTHVASREASYAKAKAQAVETAIARPHIGAIPQALPGIGRIEREMDAIGGKVKALYKYLTVAGIIGLIGATIFDQFGLGWLRCKGVGRVGRKLCGLTSIIESLAADVLDVILVTHLCEMVTLMTKGADYAAPVITRLSGMTEHLIKCQGASKADDWTTAWFEPPPTVAPLPV